MGQLKYIKSHSTILLQQEYELAICTKKYTRGIPTIISRHTIDPQCTIVNTQHSISKK